MTLVDSDLFEIVASIPWHGKTKTAQPGSLYVQHTSRPVGGRKAGRKTVMLHRLVMLAGAGEFVDHVNGNTLDNRRANLRVCTPRENTAHVVHSKNQKRGGFKGVSWHKKANKWEAGICAGELRPNGKRARIHLGLFLDASEAARAYDAAAATHFGAFASLNFPLLVEGERLVSGGSR